MFVPTSRSSDKPLRSDAQTTVEIVSIQSGNVRVGINASEDLRLLPDRQAPWAPEAPAENEAPTLPMLRRLLDKRLEIAREGICEVHELLRAGQSEDARILLEKVDEDLHLLRRRVKREFEKTELLTCGV